MHTRAFALIPLLEPLNYAEINIGLGESVIITGAYTPFDEWLALADLACRIESAFE